MNQREQLAKENDMSIDFVNWFFDNKKEGCGNVWFMMMAAMWEGWKPQSDQVRLLTEQRDAVVADLGEMKSVISENWNMRDILRQILKGRPGGVYFNKWEPVILKALNELPATDAAIAALRAEGVEMFAESLKVAGSSEHPYAAVAREFARQLRESKGANHE